MVLISKKALVGLAKDLNAIDLTSDREVRKGCERLDLIAFSVSKGRCNGCIFKDFDNKFYAIFDRTVALWIYFFNK